jgi:hypothetical protein
MKEMPFRWEKKNGLWAPILDSHLIVTIHMHSKALNCFLSDLPGEPNGNYDFSVMRKELHDLNPPSS